MAYILHIETSTKQCSVAIGYKGKCISEKKLLSQNYSHEEKLHVFIQEALEEVNLDISELGAVSVSKGPGSFTGLRIGVAAAKGICFALDLPLIAVNTLKLMIQPHLEKKDIDFLIPMLDARRMEVYTAIYDKLGNCIQQTNAHVLTESSFQKIVGDSNCFIIGNGALKFQNIKPRIKAYFSESIYHPSAKDMCSLSWEHKLNRNYEDINSFEPYYLKDFQTTLPKNNK